MALRYKQSDRSVTLAGKTRLDGYENTNTWSPVHKGVMEISLLLCNHCAYAHTHKDGASAHILGRLPLCNQLLGM